MGDKDDFVVGLACPECGEDVCVLADIKRSRTHCSRVLPLVGWGVLCLGLIWYWVSIGNYSSTHASAEENASQVIESSWWSQASFEPAEIIGYGEGVSYISTRDLQDAIDGDDDAMGRVVEKFGEASKYNQDPDESYGTVERVQFAWHEPYGSMGSSDHYTFGRSVLILHEGVMLQDIRDEGSVGHDDYHWGWEVDGWSFWPGIGYTKNTQNGGVFRSWNVDLVGVFQLVSACLVGAWLIGLAVRLFGVSGKKKAKFQASAFCMLFVLACVLTLIFARHTAHIRGENSQGGVLSGAFTIEYLKKNIADEIKLIAFCQDLLDILPEGEDQELLLAQAWEYAPYGVPPISPSHQFTQVAIGNYLAWFQLSRYKFEHPEEAYKFGDWLGISKWAQLFQFGALDLRWGPLERQSVLELNIFGWISIGVMFWMIWAMFHWMARFVFRRVQKRRVTRNQCVFCAYPLTQAGAQARYPQQAT